MLFIVILTLGTRVLAIGDVEIDNLARSLQSIANMPAPKTHIKPLPQKPSTTATPEDELRKRLLELKIPQTDIDKLLNYADLKDFNIALGTLYIEIKNPSNAAKNAMGDDNGGALQKVREELIDKKITNAKQKNTLGITLSDHIIGKLPTDEISRQKFLNELALFAVNLSKELLNPTPTKIISPTTTPQPPPVQAPIITKQNLKDLKNDLSDMILNKSGYFSSFKLDCDAILATQPNKPEFEQSLTTLKDAITDFHNLIDNKTKTKIQITMLPSEIINIKDEAARSEKEKLKDLKKIVKTAIAKLSK